MTAFLIALLVLYAFAGLLYYSFLWGMGELDEMFMMVTLFTCGLPIMLWPFHIAYLLGRDKK